MEADRQATTGTVERFENRETAAPWTTRHLHGGQASEDGPDLPIHARRGSDGSRRFVVEPVEEDLDVGQVAQGHDTDDHIVVGDGDRVRVIGSHPFGQRRHAVVG